MLLRSEAEQALRALERDPDKCPAQADFYGKYRNTHPGSIDACFGTNLLIILPFVRQSQILRVVAAYLDSAAIVAPIGSMLLRYVEPAQGQGPVGWHQDGARLEMLRMLTCWVPLDPCGEFAPGLGVEKAKREKIYDEQNLRGVIDAGPGVWAPAMESGDVLLFDPFTIHATHFDESMTGTRYSMEIRMCPLANVLDQPVERIQSIYRFLTDDFVPVGVATAGPWNQPAP